jgi:hypothetical protein
VLGTWLGDAPVEEFRARALSRTAIARPATARDATRLLTWDVLDRVLAVACEPDVLVVARGRMLPLPVPRSLATLRGYFAMGVGLCVRHAERCDPGLASVAAAFEADLGTAHVQLFVTPGKTHGFGWHFDDEHVFVAQTAGVKDYYFRPNTATTEPASPAAFQHYGRETSVMATAKLVPGDFLYLPARWWHMALCYDDALSISVGVRPRDPC